MKEINIDQATALTSPDPLVLVCTKKADGKLNMAPVSFFMYASFNPPMLAFAMGKAANSGENIRRTGKAVLAAPGVSLKDAVMAYGSLSGGKKEKLAQTPIALQRAACHSEMAFGCQADAQTCPPRQQRSFFVQNCDR